MVALQWFNQSGSGCMGSTAYDFEHLLDSGCRKCGVLRRSAFMDFVEVKSWIENTISTVLPSSDGYRQSRQDLDRSYLLMSLLWLMA